MKLAARACDARGRKAGATHACIVHSRYANSGMIMCILGIPEIIVASILVYANNFACTALLLHAKTFYMNSALVYSQCSNCYVADLKH